MANQTLIFVVLPNGLANANTLNLSIFLTPHLSGGATLAAFPDVLNWAPFIQQKGLQFELTCGALTTTVAVNRAVLRPDLWAHLFTAKTFVAPYTVPAYDQHLIVSYPARDALAYLKYAYQFVGQGLGAYTTDRQGFLELFDELIFRKGQQSTLDDTLAQTRVELWNQQHSFYNAGLPQDLLSSVQTLPPDGVAANLSKPLNTADTIKRFALFHHLPPAPNRPPLPTDFSKTLDFHGALTALSSYPTLLRALGLVFDVQVP